MTTLATPLPRHEPLTTPPRDVPPLQDGDRLTRAEFERRYDAMPELKKAELIEGVVHMGSPVSASGHGEPHFDLITLMGLYRLHTPGVVGGDNTTVRLDLDNEPQPDVYLRILAEFGGQCVLDSRGYVAGAPELVAEVAASSVSYDMHDKLNAYRRNQVREYLVWRVRDREVDWFVLREGRFEKLPLGAGGRTAAQRGVARLVAGPASGHHSRCGADVPGRHAGRRCARASGFSGPAQDGETPRRSLNPKCETDSCPQLSKNDWLAWSSLWRNWSASRRPPNPRRTGVERLACLTAIPS